MQKLKNCKTTTNSQVESRKNEDRINITSATQTN